MFFRATNIQKGQKSYKFFEIPLILMVIKGKKTRYAYVLRTLPDKSI